MNSAPTIGSMIRFSWAKSQEILSPFNFKRWFKILIIVSFAASGIPAFGIVFNAPKIPAPASFAPRKITVPKISPMIPPKMIKTPLPVSAGQISTQSQGGVKSFSVSQDAERIAKLRSKMEHSKRKARSTIGALQITGIIVLGIGLVVFTIFFLWISSRLNFVLLNTLVTKDTSIKETFRASKETGDSYFGWTLIFWGASFFVLLMVALAGAFLFAAAKGNTGWIAMIGIPLGSLTFIFILAIIAIGTAMHDFVLPIMYREKIPAMEAVNKFLKVGMPGFRKIAQYLLIIFGFWILATILQAIVAFFMAAGGLIAGGILAIPGIILIKVIPFLKIPLIILSIFIAVALILAVIMVIGMVMLPAVIFFRVFALAYLTRLYPECDLLGFVGRKP